MPLPNQPRFLMTPAHAERPRGKWIILDRATGTRYEAWGGEDVAKKLVKEIEAAEARDFFERECTPGGHLRRY